MRIIVCHVSCVCLLLAGFAIEAHGMVNPRDLGAKGDGVADDTAAIQAALDRAGEIGDVVSLPPGQYRLNGTLTIPEGVTLEGTWRGPHTSHLNKGSVLLAYSGRDDESATPLIGLQTSSALKGVTIFYPEQKVGDIHPYPWTIQGRGQHYNVIDVTIVNAYNGIDCGTFHNEGHHLRNVHMCAVNKGVFIDQTSDIGRVENVHIHNVYWWRVTEPYRLSGDEVKALEAYTLGHLEGFIIGRTDWEYMSDCFVIWAKIGFHFIETKSGKPNVVITQSGSDIGPLAVQVDAVQDHAGVAFENCQFMSGFETSAENKGPVKLSNCGFWGQAAAGPQMVLRGGTVTLTATHFDAWDQDRKGEPCVKALGGTLLMQGCEFVGKKTKSPHVLLGKDIGSAVIMGNHFCGREAKIINETHKKRQIQIVGNVTE